MSAICFNMRFLWIMLTLVETCLAQNKGYSTIVIQSNPNDVPQVSTDITLQCQITDLGVPQVSTSGNTYWFLNGNPIRTSGTSQSRHELVSGSRDMILKISDLEKGDNGKYTCKISNGEAGGKHVPFEMEVRYKPESASITSSDQVVGMKQEFTLTCSLGDSGMPRANAYTWYLADGRALLTTEKPTYTLPWARPAILNILCDARNEYGITTKSSAVTMWIQAPVKLENPEIQAEETLHLNSSIQLECIASGSDISNITWFRNNVSVASGNLYDINVSDVTGDFSNFLKSAKRSVLTLQASEGQSCSALESLKGRYNCKVYGKVAGHLVEEASPIRTINIIYGPLWNGSDQFDLLEGQSNVHIQCAVCGQPAPDISAITWSFKPPNNDIKTTLPHGVENKDNVLVINKVYLNHTGIYSCELQDKYQFNINLNVTSFEGDVVETTEVFCCTGGVIGFFVTILIWGVVFLYLNWFNNFRKKNDSKSDAKSEKVIDKMETVLLMPENIRTEEQESPSIPPLQANSDNRKRDEEARKMEREKKASNAAQTVEKWLKDAYMSSLQWMDPLTHKCVWGIDSLYGWLNKKKSLKGITHLGGSHKGKMTVINRICIDWAQGKETPFKDVNMLICLPASDIGADPVEVLKSLIPNEIIEEAGNDYLMHYFHSYPERVCFIYYEMDALSAEESTSKWNTLMTSYINMVTLVTSEEDMTKTKAAVANLQCEEFFMPGYDDVAKRSFVESYFGKELSISAVAALLYDVTHDSCLPMLTDDPDSLSLLCFIYDQNRQTKPEKLPKSISTLMDQIVIHLLKINEKEYKLGYKVTEKSLKKMTNSKLYRYLLETGSICYKRLMSESAIPKKNYQVKEPNKRVPFEPESGSFIEFDIFFSAFWFVQTDKYKDKSKHPEIDGKMALYTCGLLADNAVHVLIPLYKTKNAITSEWIECLGEATENCVSKVGLLSTVYDRCIVVNPELKVDIEKRSLRGISALLDLIQTKPDSKSWLTKKIHLDIKSKSGCLVELEKDKEQTMAILSRKHAKDQLLPCILISILRMSGKVFNITVKGNGDKELFIEFENGSCDKTLLNTAFVPVQSIFLRLEDFQLQSNAMDPLNKSKSLKRQSGTEKVEVTRLNIHDMTTSLTLDIGMKTKPNGILKWKKESQKKHNKLVLSTENGSSIDGLINILHYNIYDNDNVEYLGLVGKDLFISNKEYLRETLKGRMIGKNKALKCALLGLDTHGLMEFDVEILTLLSKRKVKLICLVTQERDDTQYILNTSPSPSLVTEPTVDENEADLSITEIFHQAFKSTSENSALADIVVFVCRNLPKKKTLYMWCDDDLQRLVRERGLKVDPSTV